MQTAAGRTAAVFISGGPMTTKYYRDRSISDKDDVFFIDNDNKGKRYSEYYREQTHKKPGRVLYDTRDFKCRNCGFFVTASRELSGVNNRNHCPRCLWSRHMDITPGDRASDCLSRMRPIGLTVKKVARKYGSQTGELMVIHACAGCDKVSINRIAADDDAQVLWQIFTGSLNLPVELLHSLEARDIHVLQPEESEIVHSQLFGVPVAN